MSHKILVVDDEEQILNLLEQKLISDGFQVITANRGQKAVELAQSQAPNLILLDIMMPDMDGADVATALKNDHRTQYIPILFLSGIVAEKEEGTNTFEVKIGERSFDAIPKPFAYEDLLTKVKAVLK